MTDFGIFAPAGFATDPAAVDRAVARLTALGHRVVVDPTARAREQRFSAGDDARLAAIARMAADPDVDVAVSVRGGYGWSRLVDRIDYAALASARKRWMGHSDFTAFALAALAQARIVTYAGPMAAYDFGAESPSEFTLTQCFGVLSNRTWDVECALDGPARTTVEGMLWGGNLAMVTHVVGTRFLPDIAGGILFLEDVAEHPYRIERMLYQLFHAGVLERQRAVLLGRFTEYALNGNDGGYDLDGAIAHLRARVRVPIYTGLPFGHVPDKLTLPVGGQCRLDAHDGTAKLTFSGYA